MGLFDDITCKYPLPIEGANSLPFQTKDTPAQYMNLYEIREDGTLWHEDHDIEDHSIKAVWKREHPGEEPPEGMFDELDGFCGCMTHVNKRWVPVQITGEIVFYSSIGKDGRVEFSAYFVAGKVNQLHVIEHRAA